MDTREVYRAVEGGRGGGGEGRRERVQPEWEELGRRLEVVTQCGVEVRREGGDMSPALSPGETALRHHPLAHSLQRCHHGRGAGGASGQQIQVRRGIVWEGVRRRECVGGSVWEGVWGREFYPGIDLT